MTTAAATRINRRLRTHVLRLHVRRVARGSARAAMHASATAVAGVLLLHALPAMLGTGFPGAAWAALAAGVTVFVASLARALARDPAPDLHEAALALESRLEHADASLVTALDVSSENAFLAPMLDRADAALRKALSLPSPHVLGNRDLIALPLMLIMAATATFWAAQAAPVTGHTAGSGPSVGQFSIDVHRQRDAADAAAAAEAMGLKRAAERMQDAARAMRNASVAHQDRQAVLDRARKAAQESPNAVLRSAAAELPETAPQEQRERELLASRLERIAMGAGESTGDHGGTTDSGREGRTPGAAADANFVPVPAITPTATDSGTELASQTPQRRELVLRAMAALEE